MNVAVIGAGPAGLTCALKLVEAGIHVDVYESDSTVGGMTKSFDLWGQRVDVGPHRFFSMDEKINSFWRGQVGEDFVMVDRLTRIYYNKKFFLYPVKAMNALKNLGFLEAMACVLSYIRACFAKKGDEKTFEEWVSHKFGYKLYSVFFKTYSERLWGISCKNLDADFARQRIKGLNLFEVIKSAIIPQKGVKHKTLVEQFAYPNMGAGVPYENIAKKIETLGGVIERNKKVQGLNVENKICNGIIVGDKKIPYDFVVSTAPFTDMLKTIPGFSNEVYLTADELVYRNTTLVYLKVNQKNLFKDNWLYIHDKSVHFGRMTNFRNWSPYITNGEDFIILALEYWSYDDDELWKSSDEKLIELAKEEVVKTALVKEEDVADGYVLRLHRSYPVYSTGYREKIRLLQEAADTIRNVAFIGRNGSFKYNNQDHSILMGLLAAENIISGENKNNLWNVNTDYDYQESGKSMSEAKSGGKH